MLRILRTKSTHVSVSMNTLRFQDTYVRLFAAAPHNSHQRRSDNASQQQLARCVSSKALLGS